MKNILKHILIGGFCMSLVGCQDSFIDLTPPATLTDAVYFKQAADFKEYTGRFYNYREAGGAERDGILQGWSFGNMDNWSDISANNNHNGQGLGTGIIASSGTDWGYGGIRHCNIVLQKAAEYAGTDIAQYVGEAYFFRAYSYFSLLKSYGGVPLVTTVLDVDSPELYGPRNSRYEVVAQILADLDQAIERLPVEQNIPAADKGRVSRWAAKAFKAQVQLYEATWEKYVGRGPDGDGTSVGAGTAGYDPANVNKYLADAIAQCEDVIANGGYELWNKNADSRMGNRSSWYLFNLEDAESNPGGYDKTTNKEFILYSVYDFTHRQGRLNVTWTADQLAPSRKFVDMVVCTDGLPPEKSPLFQGYHTATSEFQNRDLRLVSYLYGPSNPPTSVTLDYANLYSTSGYGNRKYAAWNTDGRRPDNTESANWPIIRLAEVYLMYAEALYELNRSITDEQLNNSINRLRLRGGVAPLTNALATAHGLDMLEEIRRERGVELYREGKRFDDLKRWGILEESLNPSRMGRIVGNTAYTTPFKDASGNPTAAYKASGFIWGEENAQTAEGSLPAIVISSHLNHTVRQSHYLNPIPLNQRQLNDALLQNPGY